MTDFLGYICANTVQAILSKFYEEKKTDVNYFCHLVWHYQIVNNLSTFNILYSYKLIHSIYTA